jgi:hypothetical protein
MGGNCPNLVTLLADDHLSLFLSKNEVEIWPREQDNKHNKHNRVPKNTIQLWVTKPT